MRLHWLFVIARNSNFAFKGRTVDTKQIRLLLGVRCLLEGSVLKARERVRITSQLIDTATGAHLWADKFDGTLSDIFDLQDRVTARSAGSEPSTGTRSFMTEAPPAGPPAKDRPHTEPKSNGPPAA